MTEAQGVALLLAIADLTEWVQIVGYFCAGLLLALIWSTTWRG